MRKWFVHIWGIILLFCVGTAYISEPAPDETPNIKLKIEKMLPKAVKDDDDIE